MSKTITSQQAIRQIKKRGIESVLKLYGFQPAGQSGWVKEASRVNQVIYLEKRFNRFGLQWGVVCPEATPYLFGKWGLGRRPYDIATSVMLGRPSGLGLPPDLQNFSLKEPINFTTVDQICNNMGVLLPNVARFLEQFVDMTYLKDYLLRDRGDEDRRGFLFPTGLGPKIFNCAVLSVIAKDEDALSLVKEARNLAEAAHDSERLAALSSLESQFRLHPPRSSQH